MNMYNDILAADILADILEFRKKCLAFVRWWMMWLMQTACLQGRSVGGVIASVPRVVCRSQLNELTTLKLIKYEWKKKSAQIFLVLPMIIFSWSPVQFLNKLEINFIIKLLYV